MTVFSKVNIPPVSVPSLSAFETIDPTSSELTSMVRRKPRDLWLEVGGGEGSG